MTVSQCNFYKPKGMRTPPRPDHPFVMHFQLPDALPGSALLTAPKHHGKGTITYTIKGQCEVRACVRGRGERLRERERERDRERMAWKWEPR